MLNILLFVNLDKAVEKPECLLRVEKLAKKQVTFINCDITNKQILNHVFKKVMKYPLILYL